MKTVDNVEGKVQEYVNKKYRTQTSKIGRSRAVPPKFLLFYKADT